MIEVFVIIGQFIADNSGVVGFFLSIGCAAGAWHLSKDPTPPPPPPAPPTSGDES